MPFGLAVAVNAFQHKLDTIVHNLEFCSGIVDNVIIWGE